MDCKAHCSLDSAGYDVENFSDLPATVRKEVDCPFTVYLSQIQAAASETAWKIGGRVLKNMNGHPSLRWFEQQNGGERVAVLQWTVERTLNTMMFAQNGRHIGNLEMYTQPGRSSRWPLIGPGCTVEAEPWSNSAIKHCNRWLKGCLEGHPKCHKPMEDAVLPARLIDVGPTDEDVRLYTTDTTHVRYAALSHCWGGKVPSETTTSTLESHKKRIVLGGSSKTFSDAIRVTRALGLRYIWIDSLCIIQDDKADWEAEALKMSEVYRNATITLSADAASNTSEGLFASPAQRQMAHVEYIYDSPSLNGRDSVPIHVRIRDKKGWPNLAVCHSSKALSESRLASRAWILQERILSQRILHFFEEEIVWSCSSLSRCECRLDPAVPETLNAFKRIGKEPNGRELYELTDEWPSLVRSFTHRNLTKMSDRLPALSGLARLYAEYTSENYFAGLWGHNIQYELLWISDHEAASTAEIQRIPGLSNPTWSWGSVMGPVQYIDIHKNQFEQRRSRNDEVKPLLDVLGGSAGPETPNLYGNSLKAVLVVVGQLLKVHFDPSREVWRPYQQQEKGPERGFKAMLEESRLSGNHSNEMLFERLVAKQNAPPPLPEPNVEPQVIFDVLSEHVVDTAPPTTTETPQYYFLRAAQYIVGGTWTMPSRENMCLLLKRTSNPILDAGFDNHVYTRAGIVLWGFSSKTVWTEEVAPTTKVCLL